MSHKHSRKDVIHVDEIAGLYTHAAYLLRKPPHQEAQNGNVAIAYSKNPAVREAEEHIVKCYKFGDQFDVNRVAPMFDISSSDLTRLTELSKAIEAYYRNVADFAFVAIAA